MWPTFRDNPIFAFALFIVLFTLFVFLGLKSYQTYLIANRVDQPSPMEHTIYIEGIGKENAVPDIAVMTFGIQVTSDSVANAQKQNTDRMNVLIEKIKGLGVAKEDLQTKDYSAYEKTEWNYTLNKSESKGWTVSQSVDVKIRDKEKISTIIATAGQNGSTSINGPVFKVDDTAKFEASARAKALADAQAKAQSIANTLGVKIQRVIGYNEYKEDPVSPYGGMGMGGMVSPEKNVAPPNIESGTQEIKLHATVTFLISN